MTSKVALKLAVVTLLFALAGGSMFAAPIACAVDTLQSYVALGTTGCTIGDKTFSNFADFFLTGHGTDNPLSPGSPITTGIVVTPITTGNYGLTITYFLTQSSVDFDQSLIMDVSYLVGVSSPFSITSVYTSPDGGTIAGSAGASVNATKDFCLGAAFDLSGGDASYPATCAGGTLVPGTLGLNSFNLGTYVSTPSGITTLASGQHLLGVTDLITLRGGTVDLSGTTTARIDSITNQFIQTQQTASPEPATFLLLGSALLGLGMLRRKKSV